MLGVIRHRPKRERATASARAQRHALVWHSTLNPPPPSIGWWRLFGLLDERLQSGVDRLLASLAHPFSSNRALVVDDVDCRCRGEVPFRIDRTLVIKRTPIEFFLVHDFLEFTRFMNPGIDADEGKRFIFERCYERPLVWPSGPSRQSEFAPKVEQYDFAAIVG
jgi:hypothetical protein